MTDVVIADIAMAGTNGGKELEKEMWRDDDIATG
jgi:hypothetical protein